MQGRDTVGKTDGGADMAHPVVRRRDLGTGEFTGYVGNQPDGGRMIGNRGRDLTKWGQHRLHQRRMEGMGNGQLAALDAFGGELLGNRQHCRRGAGDDHTFRPIDRGDGDLGSIGRNCRPAPRFGGYKGNHRPIWRQRPHQPSARRHQL